MDAERFGSLVLTTSEVGDVVPAVFTPVLAKHSKSFSLIDFIAVGVDRMQRNFEPMRKQVEVWQRAKLTDVTAKVALDNPIPVNISIMILS